MNLFQIKFYMIQNHPFHLVTNSPWPLYLSFMIMYFMLSFIYWMNFKSNMFLFFNIMSLFIMLFQWWRDVIRESTFQGNHTKEVYMGLCLSMILFIMSEIFFFISFFWSFFHSYLSPDYEIGMNWPPKGIIEFNPLSIPLLNTIILISSGISITWSHNLMLINNLFSMNSLLLTIFLGLYFSSLQLYEYILSPFTICDSIYGSLFFMMTGFHGIHVLIGTLFLIIMCIRMYNFEFSKNHHFGFEASIWYWHFVDVVWLFLYISIY